VLALLISKRQMALYNTNAVDMDLSSQYSTKS